MREIWEWVRERWEVGEGAVGEEEEKMGGR